jgi:3-phenylpropionate/cinnamic acid dioxygenase small subunit
MTTTDLPALQASAHERLLLRLAVEEFLFTEAAMLDEGRFREWLDVLTPDIRYVIPLRTTMERSRGDGISSTMTYWDDDFHGLEMRVMRLDTEYAWAEDPPSRTRHFVSNVRVEPGARPDEHRVRSCIQLHRSRGDSAHLDILTGAREDLLRETEIGLRLAGRVVTLDQSVIPTHNLGFFF